jgi:hypothetical protein
VIDRENRSSAAPRPTTAKHTNSCPPNNALVHEE